MRHPWGETVGSITIGGGFKYFLILTPVWEKISNLTNIFQMGWLKPPSGYHQPGKTLKLPTVVSKKECVPPLHPRVSLEWHYCVPTRPAWPRLEVSGRPSLDSILLMVQKSQTTNWDGAKTLDKSWDKLLPIGSMGLVHLPTFTIQINRM